ncbi:TetR/AcrR family transcriptional regulator [Cobetia marina]
MTHAPCASKLSANDNIYDKVSQRYLENPASRWPKSSPLVVMKAVACAFGGQDAFLIEDRSSVAEPSKGVTSGTMLQDIDTGRMSALPCRGRTNALPEIFDDGPSMIQHDIAARLEALFSQRGFAEPSVSELKAASGVSLRTLYRHFPSKESMVIGALQHRHERYLAFLEDEVPSDGAAALSHLYRRLGHWMKHEAPNGCMSINALAAFPDNRDVSDAVTRHKREPSIGLARAVGGKISPTNCS